MNLQIQIMISISLSRLLRLLLVALSSSCLTVGFTHATPATASFVQTVDVAGAGDHRSLSGELRLLADPERKLSANDIAAHENEMPWQQSPDPVPNLGLHAPPHWFVVRLSNTSQQDWHGLLEMSYTMIDRLDVYFAHQQKVTRVAEVGDQRPFANRPLANRNFLIPVQVPAGDAVLVVMLGESAGALKFPLDLWQLPAFFEHDQRTLAPQLVFVGVMLALVLYNLFLLLATRDWNYLWYALSMISISFVVMSFHGILAQYVWPTVPALNNPVLVGSISLDIFAATIFTYTFLNLKRFPFWLKTLFIGHTTAGALVFILNLILPYAVTIKLAALISVTGSVLGISTGIVLWHRGEVLAKFYTIAWFLLLAGSVTITLSHMGFLPATFFFEYAQQIGAAAEGLLLSFALAYRMNMERQQRYQAQAELLRVQTEANLALERKVLERTSELQEANSRLQEVSATDGLTQVRNRLFFDEKLAQEWSQNARGNSQLSLLLIDGDHFKAINDTYGHLCGDAMLKHIAKIFNATVKRAGDFVARYGGEEFTILLCHTDLLGAARVAQNICEEVASQPLQWEGKSIHFTVSIGVANRQPNRDEDPKALLREADAALYQAKETGRNRVMLFTKTVSQQGVVEQIKPYPLPASTSPISAGSDHTTASKPSNFG